MGSNPYLQLIHNENYTIRANKSVRPDSWSAVAETVEFAWNHLKLRGHLFITVLSGSRMVFGEGPNDWGIGQYLEGLQHVAVCVGDNEDECDREEALYQARVTVVHEMLHYMQDLEGSLQFSNEEFEEMTERKAVELVNALIKKE